MQQEINTWEKNPWSLSLLPFLYLPAPPLTLCQSLLSSTYQISCKIWFLHGRKPLVFSKPSFFFFLHFDHDHAMLLQTKPTPCKLQGQKTYSIELANHYTCMHALAWEQPELCLFSNLVGKQKNKKQNQNQKPFMHYPLQTPICLSQPDILYVHVTLSWALRTWSLGVWPGFP